MKRIVREHAIIDTAMLARYQSPKDVMSVSCMASDAHQERANVMRNTLTSSGDSGRRGGSEQREHRVKIAPLPASGSIRLRLD